MTRHELYNETVQYCEQLEKDGKALILRPTSEVQIDSFEKDLQKIERIYQFGYQEAIKHIDEIKTLLK